MITLALSLINVTYVNEIRVFWSVGKWSNV